jgi:peptidase M28-like protein/PDZ domain-containing protein
MGRQHRHALQLGLLVATAFTGIWVPMPSALGADRAALAAALESIRAADLKREVEVLADDSFEGREAGSRGGHAAGMYLARYLEQHKLKPGGTAGYFQTFNGNCRNVLGVLAGSDPALKQQYAVVSAHYDHVGYGNRRNSNGPTGYIHNGADDNASGVSAVLEAARAMGMLAEPPKRSILFALWDSEENGLNGSKYWLANPTIPLGRITAAINLDMVGRLRHDRLIVYGTRTSQSLRRLICEANRGCDLLLDFDWEMKDDSDHHPFFVAGIPVLMFHTGLHEDYHRPSDDAVKINAEGMQRIDRLLFNAIVSLAEEPEQHRFRTKSRQEFPSTREAEEQAMAPLPGRLGVRWISARGGERGVIIQSVTPGSAAERAGIRPADRMVRFGGEEPSGDRFASQVLAAPASVEAVVEREKAAEPITLKLQLAGQPLRLGIAWRVDDAEPSIVQIVRVVPGSPAEEAGLRLFDRIYEVDGRRFASSDEFANLLQGDQGPTQWLVESSGRIKTVEVTPLKPLASKPGLSAK